MRCYNCGFENVDKAAYCERCATPLGGITPGQIYAPQPQPARAAAHKDWHAPVFVLLLGIAVIAVGYIVYFAGVHSMVSGFNDPNWDPFTDGGFADSFDLMLLSYVIMGIGGVIFSAGLIWLVLRTG